MSRTHQCAEFQYDKDYGAEIINDPVPYPLSELGDVFDKSQPVDGWFGIEDWDRIALGNYESNEGITSGHVYKLTARGVLVGDVLLQW